jgi:hypothetical protein
METGIKLLIKRRREEFREENEYLYSEKDYKEAERRYIRLCLTGESEN